jgi:uncharacterized membrane protein
MATECARLPRSVFEALLADTFVLLTVLYTIRTCGVAAMGTVAAWVFSRKVRGGE